MKETITQKPNEKEMRKDRVKFDENTDTVVKELKESTILQLHAITCAYIH